MGSGGLSRKPARAAVLLGVLVLLASACVATPHVTYDGSADLQPQVVVLTPNGYDSYTFSSGPGYAQFDARPDNRDSNLRQVFWPSGGPEVVDQQSCATWSDATVANTQQGAVLRLSTADGHVRAITVTKNIAYYSVWVFNVHVWDTASAQPFTLVGQVNLGSEFFANGQVAPLPWHLCARVIGSTVDLKAWHDPEGEPAWGNSMRSGSVALPDGWVYPGHAGWYIAHLVPGGFARFEDLRTWQYTFEPVEQTSTGGPPAQRSSSPGQLSTVSLG